MISHLLKTMVGSQVKEEPGATEAPEIPSPHTEGAEQRLKELEDQSTKTLDGQLRELQERYPAGDQWLFGQLANYENSKNNFPRKSDWG